MTNKQASSPEIPIEQLVLENKDQANRVVRKPSVALRYGPMTIPGRYSTLRSKVVPETGSAHATNVEQPASALVITGETEEGEIFGSTMAGLGQCLPAVRYPLEAIRCLQDSTLSIRVVFAPANELAFRTSEFFAFMKEAFPLVRRISYSDHGPINRVRGSSPNAEQES